MRSSASDPRSSRPRAARTTLGPGGRASAAASLWPSGSLRAAREPARQAPEGGEQPAAIATAAEHRGDSVRRSIAANQGDGGDPPRADERCNAAVEAPGLGVRPRIERARDLAPVVESVHSAFAGQALQTAGRAR